MRIVPTGRPSQLGLVAGGWSWCRIDALVEMEVIGQGASRIQRRRENGHLLPDRRRHSLPRARLIQVVQAVHTFFWCISSMPGVLVRIAGRPRPRAWRSHPPSANGCAMQSASVDVGANATTSMKEVSASCESAMLVPRRR